MENLELDIDFLVGNQRLKADLEAAKADVKGVGVTAEQTASRVQANVAKINLSNKDILDKYAKTAREAEALFASRKQQAVPSVALPEAKDIKDIADEVLNLKSANEQNNEAQSEGSDILNSLTGLITGFGLASVLAFAAGPILKYITSLDLFRDKVTEAKVAQEDAAKALAGTDYAGAVTNVNELRININLAKEGFISKESVLKQYNETLGKTTGQVTNLNQAEQELNANADAYIKVTLLKAAAQVALESAAKSAYEAEVKRRDDQSKFYDTVEFVNPIAGAKSLLGYDDDILKDRTKRAEIERKKQVKIDQDAADQQINIAKKFQEDAAKISKANGFIDFLGNDPKTATKTPKASKVLKTPAIAKDNYDAIVKSREALSERLLELNTQYTGEVLNDEQKEIARIKAIFTKVRSAIEEENEKIAKYNQDPNNKNKISLLSTDSADGIEKNAVAEVEKKKFDNLIKANQTYQQKALKLQEDFERDKAALLAQGKDAEAGVLAEKYKEDLTNLNDAHIQKLDSYKALLAGIEFLSVAKAKEAIDNVKKSLEGADISPELYKKTKKLIEDAEKSLGDRLYDNVGKIGDAFVGMANSVKDLDEGLANVIGTLGNMLKAAETVGKSIGDIKKGILDYSKNKADAGGGLLGTIAGVAGVAGPIGAAVGAVTSLVSGIVNIFKAAKESADKAKKEIADFYASAKAGDQDYDRLLRERARTQQTITDATFSELDARKQLLATQSKIAQSDYENALQQIQLNGKQVTGEHTERYGGFLGIGRKTKVVQDTTGIGGIGYDQLEKLSAGGKLDEATQKLFENLKKAHDELDAIGASATATADALAKVATGTTAQSITDAIITGFKNGDDAASSFANNFQDLMNNAALSIFESTYLKDAIAGFYQDFSDAGKDGVYSDGEKAALKAEYLQIGAESEARLKNLTDVTGGSKSKGAGGIAGTITAQLTEQTGSEIVGINRSVYDVNKQQLAVQKELRDSSFNCLSVLKQQLLADYEIVANTGNTVLELKNVVLELKSINKPTQSSRALGG